MKASVVVNGNAGERPPAGGVLLAAEMEIATLRPHIGVANDGEVRLMQSPLYYRARPGALTVIVPEFKKEP